MTLIDTITKTRDDALAQINANETRASELRQTASDLDARNDVLDVTVDQADAMLSIVKTKRTVRIGRRKRRQK